MAEERTSITWKSKGVPISTEVISRGLVNKDNLVDFLFSLKKDDINYDIIMRLFGKFDDAPLANPYDLLEVPPKTFSYFTDIEKKKFKTNTNTFITTVGLWIFNIYLRDFNFSRLFDGYFTETITDGAFKKIEKTLSYSLIEDLITTIDLKEWEDTLQWLMPFETILAPSHTEKMLACTKVIGKKRDELVKKYKKELDAGDIVIADQISKELIEFAKEYMGDDPSFDSFDSGAAGSIENNFKNLFLFRGAILNPDPSAKKKYNISTGNLLDGIPPEEYATVSSSNVIGAYSRGKKTSSGGYLERSCSIAYGHLKLDPAGSDCGTKNHITVSLTAKNIDDYMYSYIIEGQKLVLLDLSTREKYIGKKVKMRFSSMCKSKTGICNKCAGELFYKLDNMEVGLLVQEIPDRLKVNSLKAFHDQNIKITAFDAMKAFYPYEDK